MTTYVLGGGGLLGSNVCAATQARVPSTPIRWDDTHAAADVTQAAREIAASGPVRVAWCAGSGVVGTSADAFEREDQLLSAFLTELTAADATISAFFYASSAGGVYAGTDLPAVNEQSATVPLSAYGEAKLRQEALVTAFGEATDTPVIIGRIANLYGPGQNLSKQQGLLSWLVRASLLRQPLTLYVNLDTRRDYLYAPDAGRIVSHLLDEAAATGRGGIRILSSGRTATVGELVSELGRIRRRKTPAVFARRPETDLQPRSVAFAPLHPDPMQRTPLPVGLAAVVADLSAALQTGRLT